MLRYLNKYQIDNYEIINQAVRNNGLVIEFAGKYFKTNTDLLVEA